MTVSGILHPTRRLFMTSAAFGSLAGLAACREGLDIGGGSPGANVPGLPPVADQGTAPPLGAGSVKVGLILPMSAGGQSSQIAQQLKNAAELALRSFQGANIQLVLKDDQGTTEGGEAAASSAIAEGVQLIIGPLNAATARGAVGPARQAGVPVITFTTEVSLATRGVYLIGFLPQADVERIVTFAAQQGRKSVAGLIPDNAYGSLAEAAFRQSAATAGLRVLSIERYKSDLSDVGARVQSVVKLGSQIDCLFVPDSAGNASRVVQALNAAGFDRSRIKIMGTGLWNEPTARNDPTLGGAWYPAPSPARGEKFAEKYRQSFGSDPMPLAILGFEAVYLAAALAGRGGDRPFRDEMLLSRSGFLGDTGLFRFRSDGISERSLSVLELGQGSAREVGPAAVAFSSGA